MLIKARKISLALPEAIDHIDGFGHTSFQINGKSFVKLTERAGLSFKSDREMQEFLLQNEKFFKTTHTGNHGWVSIKNPREGDWDELNELIQEAYLRAALKHLVKEWIELHKK
ncbi:MmcQ/YjbR family DNA-binding protein [Salibacterium halotolerans]|uniref:YjbR protein n=1 Tax=Salibacterium halotolerans TaxID=1884432 RepID=A0A1I5XIS8_9BACI|nr:MmcQ/YjbR family DNA-binding protein [Salibacterium halotolerans]SFQ31850.1 hypothetical protein SAMN05518683_12836 [Salibacterium halotolerans]